MAPILRTLINWTKENQGPLFVFLCVSALLIIKVFYLPECFAYDPNDDRNHTFVNLTAAREILKTGEIPQINFFNNFGTPILGDALTYPFAAHAITYAFLPGPLAMTANRFIIAFLTLSFLYLFFRNYYTKRLATLLSIFAFSAPGFLWHFAHHHYQAALLFTAIPLCLFAHRKKIGKRTFLALFFISGVLLILSASIQVVLIIFAFLAAASFFFGEGPTRTAQSIKVILVLCAAFLATFPQTFSFFKEISFSTRASAVYAAGTAYEKYNALNVALGTLTQARMGGGHIDIALYLSLPILLAALIGTWLLFWEPQKRKVAYLSLILGLLPLAAVDFLVAFPKIWAMIPWLKSTDITRISWVSTIFLALAVGRFFEEFPRLRIERRLLLIAFLTTGIVFSGLVLWQTACSAGIAIPIPCGDPGLIKPLHYFNLAVFFVLLLIALHAGSLQKFFAWNAPKLESILSGGVAILFALLILPNFLTMLRLGEPCAGSHYFALEERAAFEPREFSGHMQPFHRLATEQKSSEGQDLAAIFGSMLGSNGRSIIMDDAFTNYLLKEDLIAIDDRLSGYHFRRAWQTEKLERLGIRYVIALERAKDLEKDGWLRLAEKNNLYLYENPKHPTPFYLTDERQNIIRFIRDYEFKGNSAAVRIPEIPEGATLVAAFTARPGWSAEIDGKTEKLIAGEDRLLRLRLPSGNHEARFTYSPYSWKELFAFFIAGAALFAGIIFSSRKNRATRGE